MMMELPRDLNLIKLPVNIEIIIYHIREELRTCKAAVSPDGRPDEAWRTSSLASLILCFTCFDCKDNLNINLRVGVGHISGRSYGAYLLHCFIFYKLEVPTGLNGFNYFCRVNR